MNETSFKSQCYYTVTVIGDNEKRYLFQQLKFDHFSGSIFQGSEHQIQVPASKSSVPKIIAVFFLMRMCHFLRKKWFGPKLRRGGEFNLDVLDKSLV